MSATGPDPASRRATDATLRHAELLAIALGGTMVQVALLCQLANWLGDSTLALAVAPTNWLAAGGASALVAGRLAKVRPVHFRGILVGVLAVAVFDAVAIHYLLPGFATSAAVTRLVLAMALLVPTGWLFGMTIPCAFRHLTSRSVVPSVVGCMLLAALGAAIAVAATRWTDPWQLFWWAVGLQALGLVSQITLGPAGRTSPPAGAGLTGVAALWVPPGHFYSPIPDLDEVRADAGRIFANGLRDLLGIDLGMTTQLALARKLAKYYGEEDFPIEPRADRRYCLTNEFFCYGDAFAYYALLRHVQPRRVVEVGSGGSSAVLLDTNERYFDNRIDCTFIEPFPERLHRLLRPADEARIHLLPQRVQDVPLAVFEALAAGDMLFIDSSHVCKTGSDVHHIVFEILPRLARGVWVHFHDIFANFEYVPGFVFEGRAWNESYVLRAFLQHNADWAIELHGATLAAAGANEILVAMPRWGQSIGGSLWLRRR